MMNCNNICKECVLSKCIKKIKYEIADMFHVLGEKYIEIGEVKEACEAYRKSLIYRPEYYYSKFSLARAISSEYNEYEEAIELLFEILEQLEDYHIYLEIAKNYLYLNNISESDKYLKIALKIISMHNLQVVKVYEIRYINIEYSRALYKIGMYDEAIKRLNEVMKYNTEVDNEIKEINELLDLCSKNLINK